MDQLRLERNYAETVRLLQARLAQGYFDSTIDKAHDQVALALTHYLAGDMAGAKVAAEAGAQYIRAALQRPTRECLPCGRPV